MRKAVQRWASGLLLVAVMFALGAVAIQLAPRASTSSQTRATNATLSPAGVLVAPPAGTVPPRPKPDATATPELALTAPLRLEPTKDIGPEPTSPTKAPSDPYMLYQYGQRVTDLNLVVRQSLVIVTGTVRDVQQARWTTDDGKRPVNPWTGEHTIFTPIAIDVEHVVKGDGSLQSVLIWGCGGQINADAVICEEQVNGVSGSSFHAGQHVMLFLTSGGRTATTNVYKGIRERYSIAADGEASNIERTLPLQELLSEVQQHMSVPE